MGDAESAQVNVASKMGFKSGDIVQELGYDDDIDFDLRDDLEDIIDSELLTEEDHDVADAVILWWRAEDGDLVDGLVDSQTTLDEGGPIWLLTPKAGRAGHVSPADIQEAAPTAGLHVTKTEGVSSEWAATRLVARRKN
ncbi:DUF3052 domain-containing protein [Neomicrococcus lactis]|uniref:DUF3052 domain-containing protein n=2 Tax=Neomicrococcus lactis TaxID=732241 RepID=A0A7W8YA21_9MICC|nr:DUF3052 domain-containing protein [Neomicrococcus lactis]MBB5597567.1 hypothetical protein [Neomicrococcus lactis]